MIWKQIVRFVVAFVFMFALAQVNSNTLKHWTPYIYAVGVVLLIAVLVAAGSCRFLLIVVKQLDFVVRDRHISVL